MSKLRKVYWDTTCFICFLNRKEMDKRLICQDVLLHAKRKELEIWTSTLTIAEVIRPGRIQTPAPPLPSWATQSITALPKSEGHIREIWDYYHKTHAPFQWLTKQEINSIAAMFEWPWIQKIIVDERTAKKAVEISRDFDLKPTDAIHAASAVLKKLDAIQHWDRDYEKVDSLIPAENPTRISAQGELIDDFRKLGPHPEDFEPMPN
jgi:predicted nucleic acid-binding protein